MTTLKPWRQVVTPHADIRQGKFDSSVFAADLGEVLAGRGAVDYRDSGTFFAKTFLTDGLSKLLIDRDQQIERFTNQRADVSSYEQIIVVLQAPDKLLKLLLVSAGGSNRQQIDLLAEIFTVATTVVELRLMVGMPDFMRVVVIGSKWCH